jgi:DNA primase
MRFTPAFLDEIKARLPCSEVVGKRVKLKKNGREWRGLSPFNQEKTPSFYVNDMKGFYHCFSSGKHGNIFNFLQETEGLSFPEAVERCAGLAGLALPVETPQMREQQQKQKSLYEVMEEANRFFENQLQASVGAKARGYLKGRELGAKAQLAFKLGFAANERFALRDYLLSKNISKEDMITCGLLIHGEDIAVPYDRFRDRVMFPIHSMQGKIVAFGGRALDKDAPAKYLNSPETELFTKGNLLYNGHKARVAAQKSERIIVVEGYVDVITMSLNGFEETVAPLGTALTENQLTLLWNIVDTPILLFDGDKAGQRAASRALDLALTLLKPSKTLSFATLPQGQDPDDILRSQGRESMEAVLANAQPLVEVLWQRETQSDVFETPEKKAALEARFREILNTLQDENLRRHYRDEIFNRLNAWLRPVQGKKAYIKGKPLTALPQATLKESAMIKGAMIKVPAREALILQSLNANPHFIDIFYEDLNHLEFRHQDCALILTSLLNAHAHEEPLAIEFQNRIEKLLNLPIPPANDETSFKQLLTLQNKSQALAKELREAERALADDLSQENYDWLLDVKLRLSNIEGMEALHDDMG